MTVKTTVACTSAFSAVILLLSHLHIMWEGQYCFARWRLSSSVTLHGGNITYQGAACNGGSVVLRYGDILFCTC